MNHYKSLIQFMSKFIEDLIVKNIKSILEVI